MDCGWLKFEMMKLWKKVFCDSDGYINLFFNNYYNPDYIEYEMNEGRLIAMLIGVPYDFNANKETRLRGLYLCGLATEEGYRCKGIMSKLMERICKKANKKNFDFCFLIPANVELMKYYKKRGWQNLFWQNIVDVGGCDYFENESNKFKINNKTFRIDTLLDFKKYFDDLWFLFASVEDDFIGLGLKHSKKDFEILVDDFLNSGGYLCVLIEENKNVNGMAFVDTDKNGNCEIKAIYSLSQYYENQLLNQIVGEYEDHKILLKRTFIDSTQFKIQNDLRCFGCKPYGMMKIIKLSEILKFWSVWMTEQKFSILVKDDSYSQNYAIYEISNLNVSKKMVGVYQFSATKGELDGDRIPQYYEKADITLTLSDLVSLIFTPSELLRFQGDSDALKILSLRDKLSLPVCNSSISFLLD